MIYDFRTYTLHPGKTQEYLEIYEREALPVQREHLGQLVGYFTSEIGPLNEIVHLWRYASLADRETRRAALEADPAWDVYRAHYKELDAIDHQNSKILKPTPFSPA